MHFDTILALASIVLIFATLFSGVKGYNKCAWTFTLLCSFDAVALVMAIAHDPDLLIKAYGRELTNLSLAYVLFVACAAFITCIVVAIRWWLRRHRPKERPVYSTRVVGKVRTNGTWTAELSKDGVPYRRVEVGSISKLLERQK